MAKYIVEIPDGVPVGDGLVPFEQCRPSLWDNAYKSGLRNAWTAAWVLYAELKGWEIEYVFGGGINTFADVYKKILTEEQAAITGAIDEAVNAILDYVKKKRAEEEEAKIKVGDEIDFEGDRLVVLKLFNDDIHLAGITLDGSYYCAPKDRSKKTGRRFPEIAELLKAMRGR